MLQFRNLASERSKYLSLFITVLVFLVVISLTVGCRKRAGQSGYRELSKIGSTNKEQIRSKFSAYSVEQQIDIYVYSKCCVEGGSSYGLIDYFNFEDPRLAKSITGRIAGCDDIGIKVYLIDVLLEIDFRNGAFPDRPKLIEILEDAREPVHNPGSDKDWGWKTQYDKALKQIRDNSDTNA